MDYDYRETEKKWQKRWSEEKPFAAKNQSDKPKYYVLDMFPYPSGSGLHVGHPLGYIASDIYARFKRHQGFNVLHPMGYDAFGLPAEQYAIQTGQHPAITTEQNVKRYREQLDQIGFSFDWDREVKTSDPNFYRWTQWIFIQLFHSWYNKNADNAERIETLIKSFEANGNKEVNAACHETESFSADDWKNFSDQKKREILLNYRLAYRAETVVNWCPALGTVLANDEVVNGVSERGGHPVEQKKMLQWSLRVSAYAQRLLDGLSTIDWSDSIKEIQRNWIGRSEGAEVEFRVEGSEFRVEVFTTRPDTIFGATFMVLAPEHELVEKITTPDQKAAIAEYLEYVKGRSERERMAETKKVTGAFTGAYAINPITSTKIPIWIGDYVLARYGTGAIMAVPSGDQRDWDFANHFGLDIIPVIEGQDVTQGADERKDGKMINSDFLDGKPVSEAIQIILEKVEELEIGKRKVNYKLRDAVFSRQRYWGEPFPVYYRDNIPYTIDEDKLPLVLPEIDEYKPTEDGDPPLGRAKVWNWDRENGKVVENGSGYPIEMSTMPGWAGSSWYFLRYMMEGNKQERDQAFVSPEAVNYWQQVDLYMGGAEHATGHLLYFRFWTKFLHDLDYLPFDEPAKKLINQGMISGTSAFATRYGAYSGINYSGSFLISADLFNELENEKVLSHIRGYLSKNGFNASEFKLGSNKTVYTGYVNGRVDINLVDESTGVLIDLNGYEKWLSERLDTKIKSIPNQNGEFICLLENEKMSKSKLNSITPDQVVVDHGADALRLHEMFLGPIEQHKPWNTKGIDGVSKFLRKLWRLYHPNGDAFKISEEAATKAELKALHKCIQKVTDDMDRHSFNTSVSHFMILVNELTDLKCNKREILEPLAILVSCHAPFIAEELWERLGHKKTITYAPWPEFKEEYLKDDSIKYPVSFNGKTRFQLELPADMDKSEVEKAALTNEQAEKWLEGKSPKKVIVVPGRIVNIVV